MSTRSRRFLISGAVVGALLAAAYMAAPFLLGSIARHALEGVVEVRELEIESVGLHETALSAVRIENSQVRFDAQQAVVRYDPWPFAIRGVSIERASLKVEDLQGDGQQAGTVPPLPGFPLQINELELTVATPWGDLVVPASVASRPGASGALAADVRSESFAFELRNPAPDRHVLVARDAGGTTLLSLALDTGAGYPLGFEGRVDPSAAARWARDDAPLPAGLRGLLGPYGVDSKGIHFSGSLRRDGGFTVHLEGDIVVRDERAASQQQFHRLAFRAAPGYTITRDDESWSGAGEAMLELDLDAETTVTAGQPEWRWDNGELSFSAAGPSIPQLGAGGASVSVTASLLTTDRLEGAMSVQGARTDWWPQGFDHYDIDGNWTWRGSSFHAEGGGSGTALPPLSWTIDSGPRGAGSLEVTGETPVAALQRSLRQYTRAVARELEVASGALKLRYQLEWTASEQRTDLEITADSVDADLDEMEIRDLAVRLANRENTVDQLDIHVSAPSLKLAAGTVAEDFEMALRVAPPVLHLDAAQARLFGGDITIRPATMNLDDDRFELFADIEHLSLEKVMALLDLDTTQLTGDVAGPVRVVYTKGRGIELNEGELHSVRPGILRFNLSPNAAMDAQLDNVALRALRDFQYDELNASVLYQPDGRYRITARIVGKNPEVLDGHPIALNPTIEGRLPALFRAFFLTGDFSQAIIERLQKERDASTSGETSTLQQD